MLLRGVSVLPLCLTPTYSLPNPSPSPLSPCACVAGGRQQGGHRRDIISRTVHSLHHTKPLHPTLCPTKHSLPPSLSPLPQMRPGVVEGSKVDGAKVRQQGGQSWVISSRKAVRFTTLSASTCRNCFLSAYSLPSVSPPSSPLGACRAGGWHSGGHRRAISRKAVCAGLVDGTKVRAGLVYGTKVAIDGSSAGGFTTLSALTFRSNFKAGCSLYRARAMHAAVKAKGLPVALVEFPDEDHGFRNADNIKAALEMEHEFFCRVLLNLPLPSDKKRLTIDNVDNDT
ncbi:unnamed protein product [Closterium sp. Naga37s-1]|nr:unnamed protein product [Closterium sp. Naga37s-1]